MFRLAHVAAAKPEQCCPLPAYSLPRVNSKTFSSSSRDTTGPINTSISPTATTMAEQESVAVFGQGGGETEVSCVILQWAGPRAGQLGPRSRTGETSTNAMNHSTASLHSNRLCV